MAKIECKIAPLCIASGGEKAACETPNWERPWLSKLICAQARDLHPSSSCERTDDSDYNSITTVSLCSNGIKAYRLIS